MAVDYSQCRKYRYFDNTYGYWRWELNNHPLFPGLASVNEHRMFVAEHENRILGRNELVHHKNEIKTDNELTNLVLTTRSEHMKLHQGASRSAEAKQRMSVAAKERANRPEERERSRARANQQWAEGNIGRKPGDV